jgi:drug/metabolite transporter (DMT)-like permease
VLAAGQIYVIGIVSPGVKRPFLFNSVQAAWAALLCVPFVLRADFWDRLAGFASWPAEAKIGVLALAFGSTVIAFSLQVRAQAHLPPTVSSLLFLLESPFAMIFSILLLGEFLGPLEAAGAALIFLSALSASLLESRRKKY